MSKQTNVSRCWSFCFPACRCLYGIYTAGQCTIGNPDNSGQYPDCPIIRIHTAKRKVSCAFDGNEAAALAWHELVGLAGSTFGYCSSGIYEYVRTF